MTGAASLEAIKARCCMQGACWTWCGAQAHGTPYIAIRVQGKRVNINVQKRMLALAGVLVSPDARIKESCGNEMCVNPDHLERAGMRM